MEELNKTYFVSSDVHSFYSVWMDSLEKQGFDVNNHSHFIILCGDLFDRGEESKQIFEFVKSLGDRFIYIRGNHEDLLFDCVNELQQQEYISEHHFHNRTFQTVLDLCDFSMQDYYNALYGLADRSYKSFAKEIQTKMKPVLDFINSKSVNYFELDDYIFVHGWVPCVDQYFNQKYLKIDDWKNASDSLWKKARWINGMEAWKNTVKIDGKTIVCGHWHTSFGNSHYHLNEHLKEWPERNKKNWQESFKPFIDDGIMAIDACTVYSGICNCIKLNNLGE